MHIKIQYLINNNVYLKKYLREHSFYYKELIRNPDSIKEIINLMKNDYHLTIPDKLDKIKKDIDLINTFVDVLK